MLTRLGFPQVGRHRAFVSALSIDALGSGVWALCVLRLRAVLPRAGTRVTNAAEPSRDAQAGGTEAVAP